MSSVFYKLLDIALKTCYHVNMNDLTISQTQKIIGWSYPTALQFAKKHGQRSSLDSKWMIPFDVVAAEVQKRTVEAQRMQARLIAANGDV